MALRSIDWVVDDAEKVAVFGPNGAGKSTLLRIVAGLLRPTSGKILLDGRPPREIRGELGYLGHEPFLYTHLTARENLKFFAGLYGVGGEGVSRALDLVDVAHKSDDRISDLSQGESRRVALARALLHDPRYLLLDEPFSNLDTQTADLVQSVIQKPGRTILLVTHDRLRGNAVCGRSVFLDAGRLHMDSSPLLSDGPPSEASQ